MGALVEALTARITAALRDAGHDAWSLDVVHDAVLEGEKVIVIFRPDATATDREFTCVAGIRQSIAALTAPVPNRIIAVKYNVTDAGAPGRSINRVAEAQLDAIRPDWRSATAGTVIREYIHDPREPLLFYTSPPVAAGTKCQISYSAVPAAYGTVDNSTQTTVSELYEPMLMEWALYRLFGHDIENTVNINRSQQRLANFQSMMGVKIEAETIMGLKNPEHKR